MPTEPFALLVYVFVLLPGIAYVYQTEKHSVSAKQSIFRETATVIVASAASLLVVAMLVFVASFWFPVLAVIVKTLVLSPETLFVQDSQLFIASALGYLAAACLAGFALGTSIASDFLHRVTGGPGPMNRGVSGWSSAEAVDPDAKIIVSVHLKSGDWVQGQLRSYSPDAADSPDRALLLSGNLKYRMAGSNATKEFQEQQILVVQSSEVNYLTYGFYDPDENDIILK